LKNLFNFINGTIDVDLSNPCDTEGMKKAFRAAKWYRWTMVRSRYRDSILPAEQARHEPERKRAASERASTPAMLFCPDTS
jgi:hypothetical protein